MAIVFFDDGCPQPDTPILGVSLRERIVIPAVRAGFRQASPDELPPAGSLVALVRPDIVLSSESWKRLRQLDVPPGTLMLFEETSSIALVRPGDNPGIATDLQTAKTLPDFLTGPGDRLPKCHGHLGRKEWIPFRSHADLPDVERWLLQGLVKDSEGFMSRYFERKISLAVTRRLVQTPLTPNQMTLVSLAIGIGGAALLAGPGRGWQVAGAFLFWLHSVLDGCDGEMARLKFAESRWGGLIDFWGDNVVHSAVFAAIAVGMGRHVAGPMPLILGALAIAGTLLSAALVHWTTMRGRSENAPQFTTATGDHRKEAASPATKIADALARRDFIYLVLALAALGKIEWFLWMGALGAPLYFLALAVLSRNTRRERSQTTCLPDLHQ